MLSLMYAGEMCYWHWQENMKLTRDETVNNVSSSNEADAAARCVCVRCF